MTQLEERTRDRVHATLEQQLAHVNSRELATATIHRVLELARGSEAERTQQVSGQEPTPAKHIAGIARGPSGPNRVAAVLVETAAQSLTSTEEAHAVADAAYTALGASTHSLSASARHGRSLLRGAVVSSMQVPEALEARVFLRLGGLPHPAPLRAACEALGTLATGGWIWSAGALIAYLLRIDGSDRAVKLVTPTVALVAFLSEGPLKFFFAPRRSFRHLVQMMLLGVKPRARSFPSGHAATSFAAAWSLGSVWPTRRSMFLAIATLVSVSRVYLGAHDPDEVLIGGALGILLAEVLRRPAEKLLEHRVRPGSPSEAAGELA